MLILEVMKRSANQYFFQVMHYAGDSESLSCCGDVVAGSTGELISGIRQQLPDESSHIFALSSWDRKIIS